MKKIKLFLTMLLGLVLIPNVYAASGNISVSGTSQAVLGNNVTVTVTLSSSKKIGSWQMDLNYDKSYLKLVKSTGESGGTGMVNSSASGVKSKSYTFTFKTLKKGNTKVSVSSYLAYSFDDLSELSLSSGSKNIKIITQEELESTYSTNADLKNLSVEGYQLTPEFNKDTLEYSLEVENEVESVNILASVAESHAEVSGTGNISLIEGNNKATINVTAQKGNRKAYIINVYRKELNPISVNVDGNDYSLVRKSDALDELVGFEASEVEYEGEKIPALYNSITGVTIVGLKDEEGNIYNYIFEEGKITNLYIELKSNQLIISPLPLPKKIFDIYKEKEITVDNIKVNAYALNNDNKFAIIYGQDVVTGDIDYYELDLVNNTISRFNSKIDEHYQDIIEKYKYVLVGSIGFSVLLLIIIIFRGPRKNKPKKEEIIEPKDHIPMEEIKEEKPKKAKKVKEEIKKEQEETEVKVTEIKEEDLLSKREQKKKLKEEIKEAKRMAREQKRLQKEALKRKNDFDF